MAPESETEPQQEAEPLLAAPFVSDRYVSDRHRAGPAWGAADHVPNQGQREPLMKSCAQDPGFLPQHCSLEVARATTSKQAVPRLLLFHRSVGAGQLGSKRIHAS